MFWAYILLMVKYSLTILKKTLNCKRVNFIVCDLFLNETVTCIWFWGFGLNLDYLFVFGLFQSEYSVMQTFITMRIFNLCLSPYFTLASLIRYRQKLIQYDAILFILSS